MFSAIVARASAFRLTFELRDVPVPVEGQANDDTIAEDVAYCVAVFQRS